MKILPNFIKTCKENIRDWKILIMVLIFAPFFVYMMYAYLKDPGTSIYNIALLNLDEKGINSKELIHEWENLKTDDGRKILNIINVSDDKSARKMIRDKDADLFVTIPLDFTDSFHRYINTKKGQLPVLINYGDQTYMKYITAASYIDYVAFSYISYKTGIEIPLDIKYESAGTQKNLNDFDLYVPALLVLSIIMILFSAGASIIREVEKETIIRLTLSRLSSFEFITALSMNQIIIGIASLFLTLLAALSVGYQINGSVLLLLLIGAITCFSVISIGIITTSFIKNMFGLLTIGVFPFFILMFFSDCFMPLPKINIFKILGNQVYLNDILPTATAVRAMNKVLNYNSDISVISFELIWMIILSLIYFGIGIFLFKRKYKY